MFNLASKIRHCCPSTDVSRSYSNGEAATCFSAPTWKPLMPIRERKHGISGAEWLRTFGKGTGNDLDHTKFGLSLFGVGGSVRW